MINRLILEKLTLKGFRKDYIVEFQRGLNFISGPLSTGKSSIAEMINYALGSKKHKAYIEIKQSCTSVELEFIIDNERFKIKRPLFDFTRPVQLFKWNERENEFEKRFILLEVDIPSNESSLSRFLLEKLGLSNIKVANQSFSFRDLYKYAYVDQTHIDTDNLLNEKLSGVSLKRKPTFEIILNIYDQFLGELKAKLKEKRKNITQLEKKKEDIKEFLSSLNLLDKKEYERVKEEKKALLIERSSELKEIKLKVALDNDNTRFLEDDIHKFEGILKTFETKIDDFRKYINKLILLRNQYGGDIEKIELIIEGAEALGDINFRVCPSCQMELEEKNGCYLCGNSKTSIDKVEIEIYKKELNTLKIKKTNLDKFITDKQSELTMMKNSKDSYFSKLRFRENQLDLLQKEYVSPFLKRIEFLNQEIGFIKKSLNENKKNLKIMNKYNEIIDNLEDEKDAEVKLKEKIKEAEKIILDKTEVLNHLSELFYNILLKFSFPKLDEAYIHPKSYLPYVRGVKYDDLGSGGAVTMTHMAYFLSIALLKCANKNHPGIIIIDSPRKNMGADDKNGDDEFKDERIFNSIIKLFIEIIEKNNINGIKIDNKDLQIIVINNGYPDFLDKKYIIKEFDGDGNKGLPYGLIDDIIPKK